jgi:hypothetical protein
MQERDDRQERSLGLKMTILLSVVSIVIRIARVRQLANVTPLGALSTFGGSRLRSWYAFAVPMSVMAISDLLLNWIYRDQPFNKFVYLCYALNVLWGWLFLRKIDTLRVGAVSLLSAVQFFLVTNFGVWLGSHGLPGQYENSFAGLMECYAAGAPFFLRTLLGDLTFSALFFGLYAWAARVQREAVRETA